MMANPMPEPKILEVIRRGCVIPAAPLALTPERRFDPKRQAALMRYYCEAGAGGVAVAVHTTQFEIRDPEIGLFEPVLETCAGFIDECTERLDRPIAKIAGVVGKTAQACREAETAVRLGYHSGLLSLSAFRDETVDAMIDHASAVAEIIPVFGFYLQPAVGGRVLPLDFWRRFVRIPNVIAVKIAPFNRYQTLDVVRAVAEEGREDAVTLYTGNDDNIIADLLTPWAVNAGGKRSVLRIRGGLLGQWCVGTRRAVQILERIHRIWNDGGNVPRELLETHVELTVVNAALFDAANGFAGVIPGVHEILRREGLLESIVTLNPNEQLSPGQMEEIDRVHRAYPHLFDDEFIAENRDRWLEEQ